MFCQIVALALLSSIASYPSVSMAGVIEPRSGPRHPTDSVEVCFENSTTPVLAQCQTQLTTKLTQEIVGKTYISLVFRNGCDEQAQGIHVRWQDTRTQASARLDQAGTLVRYDLDLICRDFSRADASPLQQFCTDDGAARSCLLNVGLHEFMHALGFAHEDLRPENPERWRSMVYQGDRFLVLTEYDPQSIMNFLNYGTDFHRREFGLSELDVLSVNKLYGDDVTLPRESCPLVNYLFEERSSSCVIAIPEVD